MKYLAFPRHFATIRVTRGIERTYAMVVRSGYLSIRVRPEPRAAVRPIYRDIIVPARYRMFDYRRRGASTPLIESYELAPLTL